MPPAPGAPPRPGGLATTLSATSTNPRASGPHPVGSPWGKENAEFMAELFRSWGYDARIEEFRVLFPTPKVRRVEMLEPTPFTAALEEPPIPEDSTSRQPGQLPLYNAYSVDGDVTGELVYVNYGRPEDYDELRRRTGGAPSPSPTTWGRGRRRCA